ncbi:hypothetical protein RFI_20290, partial [Reticulomyxa filosa]
IYILSFCNADLKKKKKNMKVIYLWHEMLNTLDIHSISDPDCFGIAVAWISYIADIFSDVNVTIQQHRNGVLPPDGNSVLRIFGSKLFAASLKMNGFESAYAISLGGLCRIFCERPFTNFQENYLLNFYHTIENFFKNMQSNDLSKKQIFVHGATLFACGFQGARTLASSFFQNIHSIIHESKDATLRLAAITMLSSFVCLEWHFWPTDSMFVDLCVCVCVCVCVSVLLMDIYTYICICICLYFFI